MHGSSSPLLVLVGGCAARSPLRAGQEAERRSDFDRAVIEYTNAVRANPDDRTARASLERVRLRASQEHYHRGRRLAAAERYDEAAIELQLATELNPTDATAEAALREVRQRLRTRIAVSRGGKTDLQTLIERSREFGPAGLELPEDVALPGLDDLQQRQQPARVPGAGQVGGAERDVRSRLPRRSITVDLRQVTLAGALASLAATTRTFYRVTAPRTITIVPDTPAKRREYEEHIVQTFFVSNADLKEVIDLLRIVVDVRQVSPMTGVNAVSLKDTPERIAAAGRLISAIDKARPEVIINVELLEVDRTRLREYGLQIASPGEAGIAGAFDANREDLTLQSLRTLTQSDIFAVGVPGLYYRLLKNDVSTRTLASPQLRTSEGMPAQARFGERVPVPMTTFAPIATGGINQQPITSFVYENIGVNIDITPRTHHNDEVSLALKVTVSDVSGSLNGLPTFGNREITTTIRLKDGETNMLAGLIRDEERSRLSGVPGTERSPARRPAVRAQPERDSGVGHRPDAHSRTSSACWTFRRRISVRSGSGATLAGEPVIDLPALITPVEPDGPPEEQPAPTPEPPPFPQPRQPPIP
jgi:general secretion pathway protein D